MLKIITIGKKNNPWVMDGLEYYQKRLRAPWNVEWVLLANSSLEGSRARQEESERILKQIKSDHFVILLDERGNNLSSPELSALLEEQFTHSQSVIIIIIGGAFGVSSELRERADIVWSLSKLVFPHQLVRLVLTEQLYRAQEIAKGSGYHHV